MQLIDCSIIRAHQHAAGEKRGPDHAIGHSRGGLRTKIHAIVNQDDLPVRLLISPGQASDMVAVPQLLEVLPYLAPSWPTEATTATSFST